MGGRTSVQNKRDHQDSSCLGIAPNLGQTSKAIYMSDALVQRLTRSNDSTERVTVYNVGPPATSESSVQNSVEKALSGSKSPRALVEVGVEQIQSNRIPRYSASPRASSLKSPQPSNLESKYFLAHDPVRRQIEDGIEEDLRLKAELTSSIRRQIRLEEAAYWKSKSQLSNARNILAACYAANRNNPIACAAAVKHFSDIVNNTLQLADIPN